MINTDYLTIELSGARSISELADVIKSNLDWCELSPSDRYTVETIIAYLISKLGEK